MDQRQILLVLFCVSFWFSRMIFGFCFSPGSSFCNSSSRGYTEPCEHTRRDKEGTFEENLTGFATESKEGLSPSFLPLVLKDRQREVLSFLEEERSKGREGTLPRVPKQSLDSGCGSQMWDPTITSLLSWGQDSWPGTWEAAK